MIDTLTNTLGPEWTRLDIASLTRREIKELLLQQPTLSEKQTLSAAINAVIRAMLKGRRVVRGLYTLAQMRDYYTAQQITGLGPHGRAMLDAIFQTPTREPRPAPSVNPRPSPYTYPVLTTSGIAYRATVRAHVNGCPRCQHLAECRELVIERDGMALCEDLLPEEILIQNYRGTYDLH